MSMRKASDKAILAILAEGPRSITDLFGDLHATGYTGTSLSELRAHLVELEGVEESHGNWQLHAPSQRRAVPDQPIVRASYGSPSWNAKPTLIRSGLIETASFSNLHLRLRATLASAPYRSLAFVLPDTERQMWRLHRLWWSGAIAFCFWTVSGNAHDKRRLHDLGWHLWRPGDAAGWDDDSLLAAAGALDSEETLAATWLSHNAADATQRVGSWFHDELGMASPRGIQVYAHDEPPRHPALDLVRKRRSEASRLGRLLPVRAACSVCGQPLSDPISVERGIGPECYHRRTGYADTPLGDDALYLATASSRSELRTDIRSAARLL